MASIEFIQKRITGYEAKIVKLEKKLDRINKAEATGWEVNPYYYDSNDKRWTLRDLEEARQNLEKYTAELAKEQEKAGSRNVEAIIQFLDGWKARVTEYYTNSFAEYEEDREALNAAEREYGEKTRYMSYYDPTNKQLREEFNEKRKRFFGRWRFLTPYITTELNRVACRRYEVLNTEKLAKDLEQDANAMYDDIIERTNKITGKITDASLLTVGAKGELNGYIKGERGTAKVETIGAGGYNIQRFHFRTLVHEA